MLILACLFEQVGAIEENRKIGCFNRDSTTITNRRVRQGGGNP